MRPQLLKNVWLANQNRYRKGVLDQIKKNRASISGHAALMKYIAASAPLHAADAARYLGRALLCLGLNDIHSSRHFAYYAELRATMAILACAGIGVFNDLHIVAVSTRRLELIAGKRTHEFAWLAFDNWANSVHATDTVGKVIRPAGQTLESLVGATTSGFSLAPSVSHWLANWGLDLAREDQYRRNESTYRPSDIVPVERCSLDQIREFLNSFWSLFQPTLSSRFDVVDEQLARSAIESAVSRQNRGITRTTFVAMCRSLSLSPVSYQRLEAVLRRKEDFRSDSLLFRYAKQQPHDQDPTLHFSMISRGAFLLRLALGAVSSLISAAGVLASELLFWLESYGVKSGIWSSTPADFIDLWGDVDDALNRIHTDPPDGNVYAWSQAHAREIVTLSEVERVAAWGLAS